MTVTITATSFPTPDAIQLSNNPAIRDQQARFAAVQAAGANDALDRLSSQLDGVSSDFERQMVFIQTYKDLADWRFRVAHQSEGRRPGALIEQYHTPIGIGRVRDAFGRSEGSRGDGPGREPNAEPGSPSSRIGIRLTELAAARFEAETPDHDVLQNRVQLPGGELIDGNLLLRGNALADELGVGRPAGDDVYCAVTGDLQDRRALQREAFAIFAALEGERAGGADLLDDAEARRAFMDAEYFLYQGPEYQRGSDATLRSLIAVSHTRIFGAAPQLPQDIDMMAYVAGQDAFRSHINRTQVVLPTMTSSGARPGPGHTHQPAARGLRRSAGTELG